MARLSEVQLAQKRCSACKMARHCCPGCQVGRSSSSTNSNIHVHAADASYEGCMMGAMLYDASNVKPVQPATSIAGILCSRSVRNLYASQYVASIEVCAAQWHCGDHMCRHAD
jgi:hypothetical protein